MSTDTRANVVVRGSARSRAEEVDQQLPFTREAIYTIRWPDQPDLWISLKPHQEIIGYRSGSRIPTQALIQRPSTHGYAPQLEQADHVRQKRDPLYLIHLHHFFASGICQKMAGCGFSDFDSEKRIGVAKMSHSVTRHQVLNDQLLDELYGAQFNLAKNQ